LQEIFLSYPQPFLLVGLKQNLKNCDNMSIIIKDLDIFEGFVISWGMGWVNLTRWHRLMERKIPFLQGDGKQKNQEIQNLVFHEEGGFGYIWHLLCYKKIP